MNIIIPNNIFATLFVFTLKEKSDINILVRDSSLITKELQNTKNTVALIPSLDLIGNKDLYVSKKYCISFESPLSNSYIYFPSESDEIKKLFLKGDVASNEVILSKIVFNERFDLDVEISLDSKDTLDANYTYHICGNENWSDNLYEKGTSFAEQVLEITNHPYVNYILASPEKETIEKFNSAFGKLNEVLFKNVNDYLNKINLDNEVTQYIKKEIGSVSFHFGERESEGFNETLQFTYYHQIINDLFDVKFV